MIITKEKKYYWTSLWDSSIEEEITEEEFIDLVNRFRNVLQREVGYTYTKFWILDNGKKTNHYLVSRIVGVKEIDI